MEACSLRLHRSERIESQTCGFARRLGGIVQSIAQNRSHRLDSQFGMAVALKVAGKALWSRAKFRPDMLFQALNELLMDPAMNLKRILCPIDFSPDNKAANEYASMLADSTGAKIIYLHTFLPDVTYGSPALFDSKKEEKRLLAKLEEEFKPALKNIVGSYVVEFGTPADRITHFANENKIDLIVMGTHGRTGLRRVIMGSVAEAVIRRAECPVLAIKSDMHVLQNN